MLHSCLRDMDRIVRVIDAEFREMPGMRLTPSQVRRLWNLSEGECEAVLDRLLRAGQLIRDPTGRYRGGPGSY